MAKTMFIAEPGKQVVVITRVFDAPRELVFKTYLDPNHVPEWWGPKRLTTTVDKMEVRPGGVWRIVQSEADGNEYAFHGVYHEIVPPERLTYTFEFEGMPGHILLETVTLEEQDGKTKMTDQSVFQSVEDRDGMLQSGMEAGVIELMDRLAELLAKKVRLGDNIMGIEQSDRQESNLPKELARPARRALLEAGYWRLEQLTEVSEGEIKQLHGIGPNALELLRYVLSANGMSFADEK